MKVAVICGSSRKTGSSSLLADRFIAGIASKGHEVTRFDAASMEIKGCLGCNYCRAHGGECVQKDSMVTLRAFLLSADMVVFATPMYYYGMSSHLKCVIDRFYAINDKLRAKPIKTVLLAVCADTNDRAMDVLKLHYLSIVKYLRWKDAGILEAKAIATEADMAKSGFPQKAFELGKKLGSV